MSPTSSRPPDDETVRDTLLRTWAAWDQAPANQYRVNAFVDACNAYAGDGANNLRKALAAARRAGMTYTEALDTWEQDW